MLKSDGSFDWIFADTILTSLSLLALLPSLLIFWSKLVASPVISCSTPTRDVFGITTVVVYGNVDFTTDCITSQLLKINAIKRKRMGFFIMAADIF
jgi:hypothetical protein